MNPAFDRSGGLAPDLPIVLLVCSNLFMTLAWYGHLKYKSVPLVTVVLVSWGIAFVEYCFAVPSNRIGSAVYSPAELKTIQEVITLVVFAGFYVDLFQGAAEPDARCGLRTDRAWRDVGVPRPSMSRAVGVTVRSVGRGGARPPDGAHPPGGRAGRLDAPEDIADRQHDIGDEGNPETVVGNERNWREFANHR